MGGGVMLEGHAAPNRVARWHVIDVVLVGGSVAASCVAGFATVGVPLEPDPLIGRAGLTWMTILMDWSWAMTLVAIQIIRSGGRRDIARLAFGACIAVPVAIVVGTLIAGDSRDAGLDRVWWDLVRLLGEAKSSFRPLFLMSLVPIGMCWAVLVRLPSIASSRVHRATAHLGTIGTTAAVIDVGMFSQHAPAIAIPAAVLTGSLLVAIAIAIARASRRADVALPKPLALLQQVGVPLVALTGASVAYARAVSLLVSPSESLNSWTSICIAFLMTTQPIAALVVMFHDYVVVGGRWALGELLAARGSPAELRGVLRRRLAAPDLQIFFPTLDRSGILDIRGEPVWIDPSSRSRFEIVGPPKRPVALIDLGHANAAPAQRAVLLGVATLALERAQMQVQLVAEAERFNARKRELNAMEAGRRQTAQAIHDCAQAPLIAVLMSLRAAERAATDPAVRQLVIEARSRIESVQQTLRDLARGQYPHVLRTSGLGAAVEVLAEGLPMVVTRSIDVERLPEQAEVVAYRFVSESLANVAKHAGPSSARVVAGVEEGILHVEVADDGLGGARLERGSGLGVVADQIRVLGGWVHVASMSGRGTTVAMHLPMQGLDHEQASASGVIDLTSGRRPQASDTEEEQCEPQ